MAKPFRQRAISTVGRAYSRDPFERVASIGGTNADRTRWSLSQTAAIVLIERGTDEFFFQVGEQRVRVLVVTQWRRKISPERAGEDSPGRVAEFGDHRAERTSIGRPHGQRTAAAVGGASGAVPSL